MRSARSLMTNIFTLVARGTPLTTRLLAIRFVMVNQCVVKVEFNESRFLIIFGSKKDITRIDYNWHQLAIHVIRGDWSITQGCFDVDNHRGVSFLTKFGNDIKNLSWWRRSNTFVSHIVARGAWLYIILDQIIGRKWQEFPLHFFSLTHPGWQFIIACWIYPLESSWSNDRFVFKEKPPSVRRMPWNWTGLWGKNGPTSISTGWCNFIFEMLL